MSPVARSTLFATCAFLLGFSSVVYGQGAPNGNDFALAFEEARDDSERQALIEEAGRRPHFFRYLQVVELEKTDSHERAPIHITALEPASLFEVKFTANQRVSLSILREDPVTTPGDAVAVSGVIRGVDTETNTIHLSPAVVRHKDRLSPVAGREMLYDIDDRAAFYQFTGGREAVTVSYRDRDLLRHRDRILKEKGGQAWADFLQRKIDQRAADREQGESIP